MGQRLLKTGTTGGGPSVAVPLVRPPDSLQSGGFYVVKCKTMNVHLQQCIDIDRISAVMQENILQIANIALAKFISAVIMGADLGEEQRHDRAQQ
ncbi:MAG: hypothetical protein ACOX7G_08780 [Candidatus Scatomorpha sp.]|jgi:hypothetical protein